MSGYRTFNYRMPAGFPGDVTRMTPAAIIEPCISDPTSPPTQTGQVVTVDATSGGVRPIAATSEAPYGIVVRAFPTQAMQPPSGVYGGQGFGGQSPMIPSGQRKSVDVLRMGYILVPVNGTPKKGGAVHVWFAATAAPHLQGGLEAVAGTTAQTVIMTGGTTFNGAPDSNGMVEVAWNIGATSVSGTALAADAEVLQPPAGEQQRAAGTTPPTGHQAAPPQQPPRQGPPTPSSRQPPRAA